MRILWNAHRHINATNAGGAEKTIREIGKRLSLRGHEIHLLCVAGSGSYSVQRSDGIVFHMCPGNYSAHIILPILLKKRPDYFDLIIDDMAHVVPWLSPFFSKSPGVVFFRHLHARTLKGQVSTMTDVILREIERTYPQIYKSWPFLVESDGPRQDLVNMGIEVSRIVKIPPGVDVERYNDYSKSEIPQVIYFAGLRPYKRPRDVLLAFQLVRSMLDSEIKLIVTGDGPYLTDLKLLADKLNISDCTKFVGKVSETSLIELLSRSWVNVHCSVNEGWCYSILEACAAGVPTVAYDVGGLDDLVIHNRTGLRVLEGDIKGLAQSILFAIQNYDKMAGQCRSLAQKFSWDRTALCWEHFLGEVMNGKYSQ